MHINTHCVVYFWIYTHFAWWFQSTSISIETQGVAHKHSRSSQAATLTVGDPALHVLHCPPMDWQDGLLQPPGILGNKRLAPGDQVCISNCNQKNEVKHAEAYGQPLSLHKSKAHMSLYLRVQIWLANMASKDCKTARVSGTVAISRRQFDIGSMLSHIWSFSFTNQHGNFINLKSLLLAIFSMEGCISLAICKAQRLLYPILLSISGSVLHIA